MCSIWQEYELCCMTTNLDWAHQSLTKKIKDGRIIQYICITEVHKMIVEREGHAVSLRSIY